MRDIRTVGVVLHPQRDSTEAVSAILRWGQEVGVTVLSLEEDVGRFECEAVAVSPPTMTDRADLLVGLGGDGTVLRAMRMSDGHGIPVLGVNLGRLGFLAEVDIPDLGAALTAIAEGGYEIEPRSALDAVIGTQRYTAFNDVVVVRVPGERNAAVGLAIQGNHFVSYAADAVIVATPTGSTAYNFSAGGPIVAPSVAGILVTPSSPHSVFGRAMVVDHTHSLTLSILPPSGRLAVEVDGEVVTYVTPGATLEISSRADAAQVVRLGRTTFYQRAQRKLGVTSATELSPWVSSDGPDSPDSPDSPESPDGPDGPDSPAPG
jgi:NAD+ kinase